MKELIYLILSLIAAFVIFKSFKYLAHAIQHLIFRIRYNIKTAYNDRIHHIKINKELLEHSIKFVEKNYLQ